MVSERQQRLSAYLDTLTPVKESTAEGFIDLSTPESRIEATPLAINDRERDICMAAHKKLSTGDDLTPEEQFLFEAIVLPTDRPAILVRDGSFECPPAPWSGLYAPDLRERIESAIRSVGRVELVGTNFPPYAGTAFVVGPGLLMTNCHVAKIFSTGQGTRIRFKDGMGSAIDFVREKGATVHSTHAVAQVVMWHPYWDMALLQVESLPVRPLKLLPMHPDDCQGRKIAVIGYPAQDSQRNAQEVQARVFGTDFGVKRFRPGYALGTRLYEMRNRQTLGHDASTLGGDSGSAVIDVETGHVIGLHFAGRYQESNYSIPAFELSRDPRVRDAGVEFVEGAGEQPNPWQPEWARVDSAKLAKPGQPQPGRVDKRPAAPSATPRHGSKTPSTRSVTPTMTFNTGTSASREIVIRVPVQISIHVGEQNLKSGEES